MVEIVDYATVLKQAETLGLRCVYYNTGAFGFPADEVVKIVGWLGPDDATIRPGLAENAVRVPPPYPEHLAKRLGRFWPGVIGGDAWVMPKSHWAFELDHGNGGWLGPALLECGIDPEPLRHRTDGSAVRFSANESAACLRLIEALLANLKVSDFAVLFPQHRHLLTVHHHQQLWWQTADAEMAELLRKG